MVDSGDVAVENAVDNAGGNNGPRSIVPMIPVMTSIGVDSKHVNT